MTSNYNRSKIYSFFELPQHLQEEATLEFSNIAEDFSFVVFKYEEEQGRIEEVALPLSMFMKTESNFTHGIYSLGYWSGYYVTLSRDNSEAVIAYKHF
jgi:hypothetical protein